MSDFLNTYELCHHGIIGQKWGIQRYQNPDGSFTDESKIRYLKEYNEVFRQFKMTLDDTMSVEYSCNRNKLTDYVNVND